MTNMQIGALIALPFFLGLLSTLINRRLGREELKFTEEFRSTLDEWGGSFDYPRYWSLIERSPKMQSMLGPSGICTAKEPVTGRLIPNYAIILNAIPEAYRLQQARVSDRRVHQYVMTAMEAVVRHGGRLGDRDEVFVAELRNPLLWFRNGVREVLALPITGAVWAGLIGPARASSLRNSWLFKVSAGITGIASFAAAVVGVLSGFDASLALVAKWLG